MAGLGHWLIGGRLGGFGGLGIGKLGTQFIYRISPLCVCVAGRVSVRPSSWPNKKDQKLGDWGMGNYVIGG